jgi:hypothetical protein
VRTGRYDISPVDYAETRFHDSRVPYPDSLQKSIGACIESVAHSFPGFQRRVLLNTETQF